MSNLSDTTLGQKLADLRSQKGCGLVWASRGIGTTPGELSKWERGYAMPSLAMLQAIASFYATDLDDLVALAVEPPPMLGRVSMHIPGMAEMSPETLAALMELGKVVTALHGETTA
jgi:transcriptional regulator with XRE-family HTH domain